MAAEFVQRDVGAALATMIDDAYVYRVPVMIRGVGFARSAASTRAVAGARA
jgi:hypothetical protein